MKRVLFVDDEPAVLEGLQDALRPQRLQWAMRFVPGSQEALHAMEREPAHVVVSDLRMPWVDGASLLALLAAWYPDTRRIVLSGHVRRCPARVAELAHTVLAKPCDPDTLTRAIEEEEAP